MAASRWRQVCRGDVSVKKVAVTEGRLTGWCVKPVVCGGFAPGSMMRGLVRTSFNDVRDDPSFRFQYGRKHQAGW